ncbi:hypothetical protein MYY11_000526 [Enterococcus faecium]|nr:hypothetical protein [Enterococcus faecium]
MSKAYYIYSYDEPQGYYLGTYIHQGEYYLATTSCKEEAKKYSSFKRAENAMEKLKLKIGPDHNFKVI